ncbi:lymphocyte cytosolic protein 2 isoform X2 [Halyomorpha halys]|uniref:lymphocyte cytosolic protein 2 isoform X2 n=1 Tax=Halyomorpha halys TaxID=286706 RepID=UPI0034D25EA5
MCFYLRVTRALVLNLARRLWTDVADWVVMVKRRCLYRVRRCFSRYDDVGPDNTPLEETFCDQSNIGGDGCFIVRKSTKHPLTLTLFYRNRPYNIPIRKREDKKIALGSKKQNERVFETVTDLINHYGKEELILFSGGEKTGTTALISSPSDAQIEKMCKQTLHHVMVHVPN